MTILCNYSLEEIRVCHPNGYPSSNLARRRSSRCSCRSSGLLPHRRRGVQELQEGGGCRRRSNPVRRPHQNDGEDGHLQGTQNEARPKQGPCRLAPFDHVACCACGSRSNKREWGCEPRSVEHTHRRAGEIKTAAMTTTTLCTNETDRRDGREGGTWQRKEEEETTLDRLTH